MRQPAFSFEIREHIAFCFSCIARTLPPEEQAAMMLKEVLGFTSTEGSRILRFRSLSSGIGSRRRERR